MGLSFYPVSPFFKDLFFAMDAKGNPSLSPKMIAGRRFRKNTRK